MPLFFDSILQVRVRKEEEALIDAAVMLNPELYANRSQFARVALIRELRRNFPDKLGVLEYDTTDNRGTGFVD